jgi:mannose-6-phosphate isomerase-like protein (cupin superfamily)
MDHLAIDEIDHIEHPAHVNTVRKPISEVLGTTDFAMVFNELAPGEAFSGALHTHYDQEEVFYIIEGTAMFERGKNRNRIEVSENELIRFAPGEFQRGFNATDERVVGLVFSAPGAEHDWAEEELLIECRPCDEETIHGIEPVESGTWKAGTIDLRMKCSECGTSYTTVDL